MSRFWEIVFCVPLLFRRHVCLSKLKHLPSRELPLTARNTVFSHLKKPQNPEDFPAIIFSHPAWGYFLFKVPACCAQLHENQGPPFEENYIIAKLTRVILVIAENKPHSHHETHFHTMKVVTILIPSFHGLRYRNAGPTN